MSPELAQLALDAVYDSDLCVDGFLHPQGPSPIPVRIRADNGDIAMSFGDVSITTGSMMFRVRVSEFAASPKGSVMSYSDPADAREWRVTSAARKDSAMLEWLCLATKVKS